MESIMERPLYKRTVRRLCRQSHGLSMITAAILLTSVEQDRQPYGTNL